jgi:hypothetical protein
MTTRSNDRDIDGSSVIYMCSDGQMERGQATCYRPSKSLLLCDRDHPSHDDCRYRSCRNSECRWGKSRAYLAENLGSRPIWRACFRDSLDNERWEACASVSVASHSRNFSE